MDVWKNSSQRISKLVFRNISAFGTERQQSLYKPAKDSDNGRYMHGYRERERDKKKEIDWETRFTTFHCTFTATFFRVFQIFPSIL